MAANTPASVTLDPEVTIPFAAATREQLLEALRSHGGSGPVVLDLSAVTDFDSAGIQLLLSLRRSLLARGDTLQLNDPSASVRDALATFGLSARFGLAAA